MAKALKAAFPFYGREYSCEGKIAYVNKQSAIENCGRVKRQTGGARGLWAYKCPWCPAWHIGHRKGSKK